MVSTLSLKVVGRKLASIKESLVNSNHSLRIQWVEEKERAAVAVATDHLGVERVGESQMTRRSLLDVLAKWAHVLCWELISSPSVRATRLEMAILFARQKRP